MHALLYRCTFMLLAYLPVRVCPVYFLRVPARPLSAPSPCLPLSGSVSVSGCVPSVVLSKVEASNKQAHTDTVLHQNAYRTGCRYI